QDKPPDAAWTTPRKPTTPLISTVLFELQGSWPLVQRFSNAALLLDAAEYCGAMPGSPKNLRATAADSNFSR
ncbi:hypothetical protein, partial [Xanthomonas populi]|uniref:hypothetical protein n=1 Tax=Xanthomonas populi TaxID=53414 RepID=UPI001ABF4397